MTNTTNYEQALRELITEGLTFAECLAVFGKIQHETKPWLEAYSNAVETSDELETDDHPIVSIGDDPGAFVLTWTWVTDDDAEVCSECRAIPGSPEYGTVGDGFDGLCPSCADKAETEDND